MKCPVCGSAMTVTRISEGKPAAGSGVAKCSECGQAMNVKKAALDRLEGAADPPDPPPPAPAPTPPTPAREGAEKKSAHPLFDWLENNG